VLIQRATVHPQAAREVVRRRDTGHACAAPRERPCIKRVEARGVEGARERGCGALAREAALARANVDGPDVGREGRPSTKHGELDIRRVQARRDRHAVLTRAVGEGGRGRRVNLEAERARRIGGSGDDQQNSTVGQPQQRVRQKFNRRIVVHVQRRSIGKENFDASRGGPHAITRKKRQAKRRRLGLAFSVKEDVTLDIRDVCRRILGTELCAGTRRGGAEQDRQTNTVNRGRESKTHGPPQEGRGGLRKTSNAPARRQAWLATSIIHPDSQRDPGAVARRAVSELANITLNFYNGSRIRKYQNSSLGREVTQ
jgi:hypothetical protein